MKTLIAALVASTFSIGAFAAASAPMAAPMMAASAPMMKASAPMMKASGAMKMKKMKKMAASAPA